MAQPAIAAPTSERVYRPAASAVAEVRVARNLEEVERLRQVWSSWMGHRDSNIDFFLRVVMAREEVIRPHVIAVYHEGVPDGILVGRLENIPLRARVGYLRLPGIAARVLTFGDSSLRGNPGEESCRALMGSILHSLRQGEADMSLLSTPDPSSTLHQLGLHMPGFFSRDRVPVRHMHHYMRLPDNLNQVYASLSRDHRSELRRKARKLDAAFEGRVRVHCIREPEEAAEIILELEHLTKKTYQRGIGVGFADTPQMHRRLDYCARMGWLRIYVLYVDQQLVSYWVGTVIDGNFCSDYLAFDPALGSYSPGTYLMVKVFESLCAEGAKEIDFGIGEGRYKERFGNVVLENTPISIFAPTARGISLNLVHTTATALDSTLRSVLLKTNLLPRIKRLWRTRAANTAAA